MIKEWGNIDLTYGVFVKIFFIGFFFDVITVSYFLIPFLIYQTLFPKRRYPRINMYIITLIYGLCIYIFLFNAFGEWYFWQEFTTRYNFIAVDYLIYTRELIGTIKEAYLHKTILFIVLLATGAILLFTRKYIVSSFTRVDGLKNKLFTFGVLLFISSMTFITPQMSPVLDNPYQ